MSKRELIFGLALAIFIAFFLSRFASQSPDGLERVAMDKGFSKNLRPSINSPLAGLLGTLVVFGLGYSLVLLLKRYRRQ